jgi:hypothetical protein
VTCPVIAVDAQASTVAPRLVQQRLVEHERHVELATSTQSMKLEDLRMQMCDRKMEMCQMKIQN